MNGYNFELINSLREEIKFSFHYTDGSVVIRKFLSNEEAQNFAYSEGDHLVEFDRLE